MSFLEGVWQQVLAGAIVLFLGYVAGHARALINFPRRLRLAVTDLNLIAVYKDYNEASVAILEAVKQATSVRILAGRGTEFQTGRDGTYETLLTAGERSRRHWRILLPNVDAVPRGQDWIAHRAGELNNVRPPYDRERLAQQIISAINELSCFVEPGKFELALYDAPHVGRVILTDNNLFIAFYNGLRGGKKGPTFHFTKGEFYEAFGRYFELVWRDSRPVLATRSGVDIQHEHPA